MLLKIYYKNIVVEFLNCHFFNITFPLFLSIIHTFLFFLSFFFLLIFFHHTRIPYIPILSLFFPLLSTFQNLPLSFFLQPSFSTFFFFIFYLIPTHYPAFSVIRNGERTDGLDGSALCATTPSAPPKFFNFFFTI